jgi:7-cyano-7-deazaguanine synthase in queuosine biosynthesis
MKKWRPTKMILVCKVEAKEDYHIDNAKEININDNDNITYTFWNNVKPLPKFYSDEGIDLLYLSLFVFGADRTILREETPDSWSRVIELFIPVLAYDKWILEKDKTEKMLNFLSGDTWILHFRQRERSCKENMAFDKYEKLKVDKKNYDTLCMFSGGLDSGIGAIDLLESGDHSNVLFISHYGGGKGTKKYQDTLKDNLVEEYGIDQGQFYQNYAAVIHGEEDTTRTRSFMFFSHAIAYATAMADKVILVIPENGLISLNIPLTHTRLGTSSTRTTHPFYMKMFQEVLIDLGINVTIVNPYQFKTKGEMVLECKNREFLQRNIENTMSCSHPDVGRHRGESETCHCGYCLPCTIRKAAVKKGELADTSVYYDKSYNSGPTAQYNLNAYRLALLNFNTKTAFLKIQCSGPIEYNIGDFAELYIRGMQEVAAYLEEVNV